MSSHRSALLVLLAALVLGLPARADAIAPLGSLTQPAGAPGCISVDGSSQDGPGTCAVGRALQLPIGVQLSPDGRDVYVTTNAGAGAIAHFRRDTRTGALTQPAGAAGCLSDDGHGDSLSEVCADGRAISQGDGAQDLVFTADGRFAYAASEHFDGVVTLRRDPDTGTLSQPAGTAGCTTEDGTSEDGPGTCSRSRATKSANVVALSPDERFLYVFGYATPAQLAVFARDPSTGRLTQLSGSAGCVTEDGSSSAGPATCATARGLGDANGIAITSDGRNLYALGFHPGSVVAFSRDPRTGRLTQLPGTAGCLSVDGTDQSGAAGSCAVAHALGGAYTLSLSADDRFAYIGSYLDDAVVVLARGSGGRLEQLPGTGGCASRDGSSEGGPGTCANARGLDAPYRPMLGPEGRSLLVPSQNDDIVSLYDRNPASGTLTQLPGAAGCLSADGTSEDGTATCTRTRALAEPTSVAVAPDGADVYVAARTAGTGMVGALVVLHRQAAPVCHDVSASLTGPLALLALPCVDPNGDPFTRVEITAPLHGTLGSISEPTGEVSFAPAAGFTGSDAFRFAADDGNGPGLPATATLGVSAAPPGSPPMSAPTPHCTAASSATPVGGRSLIVTLRCNRAVTVRARLTLLRATAHRLGLAGRGPIATGHRSSRARGRLRLRLTMTRRATHAVAHLRGAARRAWRARLAVTSIAAGGGRSELLRTVKLASRHHR
jgi:DNA-binding beta-propeller fold protein YncE